MRPLCLFLVIALAVSACSKEPSPLPESASSAEAPVVPAPASLSGGQTPPAAPLPAELPATIARVNGDDITRTELESAVRTAEVQSGGPLPPSERDRVVRGLLDRLIGYKLLLQESQTRKLTVTDSEVDARLSEVRKQFPSEDGFKKMLAGRKMTVEQVRAELKNEMVVQRLLDQEVVPKAAVADKEVQTFYERNPKQFQLPETVRASHVLIAVPASATADARAEALQKATAVLKEARAGRDFAALAREHSQDPGTAASGGDLGYFQPNQMVGPFSDAAFKLAKGDVSDVVETEFGYHIIRVTDKQAARTVPLEEARPKVQQYLRSVNLEKETQAFVRSLRSKGKVEVFI